MADTLADRHARIGKRSEWERAGMWIGTERPERAEGPLYGLESALAPLLEGSK